MLIIANLASILITGCSSVPDQPIEKEVSLEIPASNLIIITVDTLRRDAVGRFSPDRSTPFIDWFLESGVSLDRHRSCSDWTYASMLCVLGGRSPIDMGFVPMIDGIPQDLDDSVDLLPEWLSDAGFNTALSSASPIINPDRQMTRGFDSVFHENGIAGTRLINEASSQLETLVDSDGRWFLSLHLFDPHIPYAPPEDFLTDLEDLPTVEWDLGTTEGFALMIDEWLELEDETQALVLQHLAVRYSGEATYTDSILASFWEMAEALGALEDTLVLMVSDHGEQFQDHERWTHGGTIFLEETASFAGFWHRDLTPSAWGGLTTHSDLAPTILGALGVASPAAVSGDIIGEAAADRPVFTLREVHGTCPLQGVEQGDLRMLYNWDGGKRLYNMVDDPLEQQNIYQSDSREVRDLWDLLEPKVMAFDPLIYDCTPQWIGP